MTHLTLTGESLGEDCLPSVQGFMNALKQMPHLHTLTLFRYLPPHITGQASSSSSSAPSQLKLDSLRRLTLEDEAQALLGFFNLVQVPNVQSMHLRLLQWEGKESLHTFAQLLWSSWKNSERSEARPKVQEIEASHHGSTRISLLDGDIAKELALSIESYVGIPLYRLFITTAGFNFDDFQALSLCSIRATPGKLISVFGQYQKLQEVNISNIFTVPGFLQFLKSIGHPLPDTPAEGDGSQRRQTAPLNFPGLVSLSCSGLYFGEGNERERMVTMLADALIERSKFSTLKELFLGRCRGFTESEYQRLCEPPIPGLEVYWDGLVVE
ncbi:hypothetical protein NMY22_g7328 [Coprinellus aureogranulatus]|nr:hypothetical protein NMY22_g7328 [Coprinellus aureogranulatus]